MDHTDSLSEERKREREFKELSRKNQEWMDRQIDLVAELLLDLWHWRKEHAKDKDKPDEPGSTPTEA